MSFVTTQPEALAAAAGTLAGDRLGVERPECRGGGAHDGCGAGGRR